MKYRLGLCAGILFFSCLLFGCREKEEKFEGTLTISFITIGKGDAFLIETPDKNFYIWDTGKKEDREQILAVLQKKGVKELEGIFLSHGHKDHAGNLEMLLQEYSVKSFICQGKMMLRIKKQMQKLWQKNMTYRLQSWQAEKTLTWEEQSEKSGFPIKQIMKMKTIIPL